MFSMSLNEFMMCHRVAKVIRSFRTLPDPIPPFRQPCHSVIWVLAIWGCNSRGPVLIF